MVSGAFQNSEAFDCDDLNGNGICDIGEPIIPDENLALGTPFPSDLQPEFNQECNRQGTTATNPENDTTLISELCTKAGIQNLNITAIGATGENQIVSTEDVGIFEWFGKISDFGQMLVFGATLLLNAITGDFIVAVFDSLFVADELPAEFELGVRIIVGLMWIALFYAMVFARSPTGQ
jgi:hypothetical protein